MPTHRILLSQAHVTQQEMDAVSRAVASGWVAPLGPEVEGFESDICRTTGVSHALALSSGTAALHLALLGLGVRPGDAVIVPTLTFAATAFAVTYAGAVPVFLDVDEESWGLNPDLLEQVLCQKRHNSRIAAIVSVDLFGRPADYGRILSLADQYDVPVLVDAAESLGAYHGSRPAGSLGRAGVYSFNGNKIITTSGGGMLVSNDERFMRAARHRSAQSRLDCDWYEHDEIGFNYRMSNILAALGRVQLSRLPSLVSRRREIQNMYSCMFADTQGLKVTGDPPWGTGNSWLTTITFDPARHPAATQNVLRALKSKHIEARHIWKPMHQQPIFAHHEHYLLGVADRVFSCGLCLPSGCGLSDADIEYVAASVKEALH